MPKFDNSRLPFLAAFFDLCLYLERVSIYNRLQRFKIAIDLCVLRINIRVMTEDAAAE